jgi:hypothetical protein
MFLEQYLRAKDLKLLMSGDWNLENPGKPIPGKSIIGRVWKKYFPNVKTPVKGDWGLCNVCESLKELSRNGAKTEADKADIKSQQEIHSILHRCERQSFEDRKRQAQKDGSVFTLLMYDLTRSLLIPHFKPSSSTTRGAHRIETFIGGLINFSLNVRYIFSYLPSVSKGGNLICTLLLFSIAASITSDDNSSSSNILWLQCDGGSENINRYLFAFVAYLVEKGIYKEAYINRMVVGHTHSQIDQLFRSVRGIFAIKSIKSLFGLYKEIHENFKDTFKPVLVFLDCILDFEDFFKDSLYYFRGHTRPLQLHFCREGLDNKVRMYYKNYPSQQKEWLGEGGVAGKGIDILKKVPCGLPKPLGPKEWVREKIKTDTLQQCAPFMRPEETDSFTKLLSSATGDSGIKLMNCIIEDGNFGWEASLSCGTDSIVIRAVTKESLSSHSFQSNFIDHLVSCAMQKQKKQVLSSKSRLSEEQLASLPHHIVTNQKPTSPKKNNKASPKKDKRKKRSRKSGANKVSNSELYDGYADNDIQLNRIASLIRRSTRLTEANDLHKN